MRNKTGVLISMMALLMLSALNAGCVEPAPVPPDAGYTLKVTDENGNTYSDILALVGPGIKVQHKTVGILAQTAKGDLPVYVVRKDVLLQPTVKGSYELIPGNNQLGIFVGGYPKGPQTIDIKWINVYYKSPAPVVIIVKPATLSGERDTPYTFTAEIENPPAIGSYEWKRNGELLSRGGGKDLTTKFTAAGTYKISVTVYDSFFNETVGTGEAIANIK